MDWLRSRGEGGGRAGLRASAGGGQAAPTDGQPATSKHLAGRRAKRLAGRDQDLRGTLA